MKTFTSPGLVMGALVVLFVLGVGILVLFMREERASSLSPSSGVFTNPIAQLIDNTNISIGGRIALKNDLEQFAQEHLNNGTLSNYGIYYRELISGPVIALHEGEGFFPASLLKIPIALWFYKQAESDPALLDAEIDYLGPPGVSIEHFPPRETLVPGTRYSIRELIRRMLAESDNDATNILTEYAGGRETINSVYHDLGVRDVDDYATYVIDTQTYAAFFRVLYNAEYLDEQASNDVLSMLAEGSFDAGLTATLPEHIVVSHKFGARTVDEAQDIHQLHDCGIVYVPPNPYLICIMTQGSDYDAMAAFIAEASWIIYSRASEAS